MVWEAKYELGLEDIDLQHHLFFNLINRISDQILKDDGSGYIKALIDELNAYARFHFTSEETMMQYANYPKYEEHKQHHLDLIQRLSIKEYNLLHPKSAEETHEIIDFLRSWFLHHTSAEDREFVAYLNEQRASH
jgi:hemerythrin